MKNTRKMMAFLIGITLLTISPAYADHDRAVTTEQMPRQAQEFIARYFPGEKSPTQKRKRFFRSHLRSDVYERQQGRVPSKRSVERGGLPLFVVTRRNRFDADRNQSTGAVSGCCGHQNRTRQAGGRGQVE